MCVLECTLSLAHFNDRTELDVLCIREVLPLQLGGCGRPGRLVLIEIEFVRLPGYDFIYYSAKLADVGVD